MNLKDLGNMFSGERDKSDLTCAQAQEIIFTHWRMAFVQQENGRYRFTVDGDSGFNEPEGDSRPVEFLYPDLFHPTSMAAAYVVFMFGSAMNEGIGLLFRSTLGEKILTEYSAWQATLLTIAQCIKEDRMDARIDWDAAREAAQGESRGGE